MEEIRIKLAALWVGVYDKFLIVVGLVFNALTVWYAWKWV